MLPLLLLWMPLVTAIQQATITPIQPRGVRFEIPDEGYSLVGLHYSINKDVIGVAAGDFNVDITTKQGNNFVHENRRVDIKPGDVIHYWVLVITSRGGEQLLDLQWKYELPTTTTTTTTTKAPTPRPTPKPFSHAANVPTPGIPHLPPTSNTNSNGATGVNGENPPDNNVPASSNTGSNQGTGAHTSGGSGSGACVDQTGSQRVACSSYPCLVFEDNFDFLNHRVWEHEITAGGGGNWEFQWYTNNRTNSYTRDGVLYIKPTLTSDHYGREFLEHGVLEIWGHGPHSVCTGNQWWGCKREGVPGRVVNPIQSARLRSSRGFDFKYGKMEVEAKVPAGDWLWPAIWLLPTWNVYGDWPASGEIDIMESRGNKNYRDEKGNPAGFTSFGSTLHFGPDPTQNAYEKAHAVKNLNFGSLADDFHKYGLEWTADHIKFFLDDEEVLNVDPGPKGFWGLGEFEKLGYDNPWRSGTKMAPFDQEFYIIMNVAVGGIGFFPDTYTNSPHPKPWHKDGNEATEFWRAKDQWYPTWNPQQNNGEDAALKVNYVRVWKLQP